MGSISNLASNYLQSILGATRPSAANSSVNKTNQAGLNGVDPSSSGDQPQLSPFAAVLSALQQLQQADPAKYTQVTQQIATNLQNAAQTAQSSGNTSLANHLTQLAGDFTNASKSGQLPNIQDLAQAVGGGHHHGHHSHVGASSTSSSTDSYIDGSSSSKASASSLANQGWSQFVSQLQTTAAQNRTADTASIILNTLSNAGITGTTSTQ